MKILIIANDATLRQKLLSCLNGMDCLVVGAESASGIYLLQSIARTTPHAVVIATSDLDRDSLAVVDYTWQLQWSDAGKASIGFGKSISSSHEMAIRQSIVRAEAISPELLKRFHSDHILIPPAQKEDYVGAAKAFGLTKMAEELRTPLDYDQAEKSQGGARWLEETLTRLLIEARRQGRIDLIPLRAHEPFIEMAQSDLFAADDIEPVL